MAVAAAGALVSVMANAVGYRRHRQRLGLTSLNREFFKSDEAVDLLGLGSAIERDAQKVTSDILACTQRYRFRQVIAGLSGRLVFEAWDETWDRPVVIKTVFDDRRMTRARHSLFNEAFVLSHLDGLRAPRLIEVGTTKGQRPFVVRESLPGYSLDLILYRLAREGRPPRFSEVRSTLNSLLAAANDIHDKGVVHGDIKPANILAVWQHSDRGMLLQQETPTSLLDFEAATVVDPIAGSAQIGDITRGTPYFMAPERYAQLRVSPASDVYSLSAVAALLLTGRPERPGSQAGRRIPSGDVRNVIRRGMSVDVTERFANAQALRAELVGALDRMLDQFGDAEVDWPRDPSVIRDELRQEASTISLRALTSGAASSYARVSERVDLVTIDQVAQEEFAIIDPITRQVLELIWFRGVTLADAAKQTDTSESHARRLIEEFLVRLEARMRMVASGVAKAAGA